jgi:hypothetical protein
MARYRDGSRRRVETSDTLVGSECYVFTATDWDHFDGEDEGGIAVHFHLQHSSKFDWRFLLHKANAFGSTSVRDMKESADDSIVESKAIPMLSRMERVFQTRI